MKIVFVVNPRSGIRKRTDIGRVIRESCSFAEFEIISCDSREHLDQIVRDAAARDFDALFAVGGDGTVHETARRLIGTRLALGVIPTGSGNGFARHLGLPMNARDAVCVARDGRIESIDVATAGDTHYVGIMGVGFDAWVADRFAASAIRGLRTYVKEGIFGYATYSSEDYEVVLDGTLLRRRALVIAVANGSQYGNNARIAPRASLTDGLLDVVIVSPTALWRAPLIIARLFHGSIDREHGVETFRAREVIIRRAHPGPAHLDGEPVTMGETIDVRVLPRALRVVVPAAFKES